MLKRIEWIDIAKGLGIIFVIFAHIQSISQVFLNYIYSFHMPLFFFLSGYLFSDSKYKTLMEFIKKKAQSLLIPYFVFSIISYIYWALVQIRMGDDIKHPDLFRAFIGIFYSDPNHHFMSYNVALWFLTCLFSTEILFYILRKKIKIEYYIPIVLIALSITGYLFSLYLPFRLPWGIDVACSAVVFYGVGYIFKTININDEVMERLPKMSAILLLMPIGYILSQFNREIDMASNYLSNYFLFYAGAFAGIFCWIFIAYLIKESTILSFFGKNSLIIFGLHLKTPVDFFMHKVLRTSAETINGNLYGVIDTIITLAFLVPVIFIINKFFPFLIGKGRQISTEIVAKEELPAE